MADAKRILHIVSAMNRGGTETLLMNIYRNLDKTQVQFDFVTHREEKCDYDDEITNLGGEIYKIPSLGSAGPINYIKELKRITSSKRYIAVHSHTDYQSGFPILAAKLTGINKRISHSHSNQWTKGNSFKEKLTLKILRKIIKYSATDYCACSLEAGQFLFGSKLVDQGNVHILKNGIDVSKFLNLGECTTSVRREFNIPLGSNIIGHVGSLSHIKNQEFILKILRQLLNEGLDVTLILVGKGQLRDYLENEAKRLNVYKNIRFAGSRGDIPRLMKAFDIFLFPSIFEGFGIAPIEAQCAGVPCVVSDVLPKTTDMGLGLMKYVSLDDSIKNWAKEIKKALEINKPEDKTVNNNFSKLGFNILENIPEWLSLYGINND
ncbi:glycosyltransferase family 1 protein [Bacillus sp. ISL-18]|uniref:glycosyltransferase family 1 protein n=1 Tax=Bacillus sp. ISL-18 TaxID=2819118 RepID=UPI001BEB6056|nr:glycosyltransferase family 1 protein [Bacillus sp. ISL-18]MBT2657084.1 glycosyltransferase family 1 protein [Bacillus sp. ISL-18]